MDKNAKYILTKIKDPKGLAKPAQVGVDLTIDSIEEISNESVMASNGKIQLGKYSEVTYYLNDKDEKVWQLLPGKAYAIEFDQGLNQLDADENGRLVQRSSLARAGAFITSSVFDPGFHTDKIGTTLYTFAPLKITQHARVAQFLIHENDPVSESDMYNGTWQNKANQ